MERKPRELARALEVILPRVDRKEMTLQEVFALCRLEDWMRYCLNTDECEVKSS